MTPAHPAASPASAPTNPRATTRGSTDDGPRPGERLRQGTVVLRCGESQVQLGIDERWSVRLDGLSAAEAAWLQRVALGTRGPAGARPDPGVAPDRAAALWSVLRGTGHVVTATTTELLPEVAPARGAADARALAQLRDDGSSTATLARRARCTVGVSGLGRVGLGIATVLATAGVGRIVLDDPGVVQATDVGLGGYSTHDVGTPREGAAHAVLARTSATDVTTTTGATLDAVVVVEPWARDVRRFDRLMNTSTPALSVVTEEAGVVVGPFVVPGRSACVRCVELGLGADDEHRAEIVAQLRDRGRLEATAESASSAVAAGIAAAQVLAHLDGGTPRAASARIEVLVPDAVPRLRESAPHPGCGCGAPVEVRPPTSPASAPRR